MKNKLKELLMVGAFGFALFSEVMGMLPDNREEDKNTLKSSNVSEEEDFYNPYQRTVSFAVLNQNQTTETEQQKPIDPKKIQPNPMHKRENSATFNDGFGNDLLEQISQEANASSSTDNDDNASGRSPSRRAVEKRDLNNRKGFPLSRTVSKPNNNK